MVLLRGDAHIMNKTHSQKQAALDAVYLELDQPLNISGMVDEADHKTTVNDLIKLQFGDILHDLKHIHEKDHQQADIDVKLGRVRDWLLTLNRNSVITAARRVKYLQQIEPYMGGLSDDINTLILHAYKIAILNLKEHVKKKPALLQDLLHLITIAIEFAARKLKHHLIQHTSPVADEVGETLALARLGLLIAAALNAKAAHKDILRLKHTIIRHELIRRMDMYALSVREQELVYRRLHDFARRGDVEYLAPGKSTKTKSPPPYLISQIDTPEKKPRRSERLSNVVDQPVLLIHADGIVQRANEVVDSTMEFFHIALNSPNIKPENDVRSFNVCGALILRTFSTTQRPIRKNMDDTAIKVPVRLLDKSVERQQSQQGFKRWNLCDISKTGVMLEGEHSPYPVGSLVEIKLSGESWYGLIRWQKTNGSAVSHGLMFTNPEMLELEVTPLDSEHPDQQQKGWNALLEKTKHGDNIWIIDWPTLPASMKVNIRQKNQSDTPCTLKPTGETGANYIIFRVYPL